MECGITADLATPLASSRKAATVTHIERRTCCSNVGLIAILYERRSGVSIQYRQNHSGIKVFQESVYYI